MKTRIILKLAAAFAAINLLAVSDLQAQFQPSGALGALAPANLSKPRPKPPFDLTGTWLHGGGADNGFRFSPPAGFKLTPEAQKHYDAARKAQAEGKVYRDDIGQCWPAGLPVIMTRVWPIAMVQLPTVIYMISEFMNSLRTVFLDGRDLPKDPNPTYMGYSVGKWEGDTLVVTTTGFNDKGWLDSAGHPQTESLRITERYHRRDFGHMDWDITIDDPKAFTKAFTIKTQRTLQADTELLEDVCENERSRSRFVVDTSVTVSPAVVSSYAGTYELAPGREIVITAVDGLLFVRGLNEPKLPLIPTSQTQFMSTATPAGFEFIKDAQGKVTHLIVRGNIPETKAVRKSP